MERSAARSTRFGHARFDFAKDYRQFALDMLEAGVSD